jgi:hypothetical protein
MIMRALAWIVAVLLLAGMSDVLAMAPKADQPPKPPGEQVKPEGPSRPMTGGPACHPAPGTGGQVIVEGPMTMFHMPMETVKAAYLGIAAAPAQEVLQKQLGLPEGVGLVIEFVDPNGPAKKAGVEKDDVLHKLNDQLIINPQQLAVLVRTFKPGDKVKLTLIRQAKPVPVEVTLVEKEVPKLPPFFGGPMPMPGGGMYITLRGGARHDMVMPAWPVTTQPGDGNEIKRLCALAMAPGESSVKMVQSFADGQHCLTVIHQDGKKTLMAQDDKGQVIFQGPINTPEELKKVPQDIRGKLEKMRQMVIPTDTDNPEDNAQTQVQPSDSRK